MQSEIQTDKEDVLPEEDDDSPVSGKKRENFPKKKRNWILKSYQERKIQKATERKRKKEELI